MNAKTAADLQWNHATMKKAMLVHAALLLVPCTVFFSAFFLAACEAVERPKPAIELKTEPRQVAQFWWKGHDCRIIEVSTQPAGCPGCYWTTLVRFVECSGELQINSQFPTDKQGLQ